MPLASTFLAAKALALSLLNLSARLGVFAGPDRCCRDHDHCPDFIARHETKHGLFNDHHSSSALCACDHKFLQCLREDGSVIAREVGRLYFDFLEPVAGGDGRCVEYEYDTSRAPEWHFEDFPYHYGSRVAAGEVSVAAEGAAALAGQERPDVAANGEDAELWNALLMNRHVRFGSKFRAAGDQDEHRGGPWESVIGEQVFPGADGG
ncbi:hypothetical protein FOCC_FOCC008443 [Frankliniella occidentalis]|nr:hypothetical protein FOCC_FOCC008443 [Frankliniella occidentalis]